MNNPFEQISQELQDIKCLLIELKHKPDPATTSTNKDKQYLTRKQVAELTNSSLTTVNQWSNEGILQRLPIGGKILYSTKQVHEAIEQGKLTKYRRG